MIKFVATASASAALLCTALFKRSRGIGKEGLCQQESGLRANRRHICCVTRWKEINLRNAHRGKEAAELIFNRIGQSAHHEERWLLSGQLQG